MSTIPLAFVPINPSPSSLSGNQNLTGPSIRHSQPSPITLLFLAFTDEPSPCCTSGQSIVLMVVSPPRSFAKIARSATFTFKLGEPANPSIFNFSEQDDSTTLKRPKDHPDAPTPNASPEKKRGSSTETTPGGSAVFGTKVPPQKSSAPKGTIQSFFSVATKEEKAMERAREAERRNEGREEREARDVRQKFLAKTKVTEDANERKRKQRAKERAVKVAAGWVPGNRGLKRVRLRLFNPSHLIIPTENHRARDS
ncbi:hypothetical protein B0H14DRAFT_2564978 [Mycena olivaceomarginata]|nr:hypothetical protein B0H14DRAFT_2564978 [Mycena olivaceomarginata]